MELLQLKYFQTVANLEHMTKAAEELNIAQPSLSQAIARLEEDIGVTLFERKGRAIRLNRFGKVFLGNVEQILQSIDESVREVRDMSGMNRGIIKLSASITGVVPDLIRSFMTEYPHIHFHQTLDQVTETKKLLEDGKVDLCIAHSPIEGSQLEWRLLRTEPIYLIVSKEHRLSQRESVSIKELENERFISMHRGYWSRELIEVYCRKEGFVPNFAMEVGEPDAMVPLVKQGLGITLAPELGWQRWRDQLPSRIRISDPSCISQWGLVWSNKHYMPPEVRLFRQFVIAYFNRLP
jgi:DNA-binding transcriptional LysR family regulator